MCECGACADAGVHLRFLAEFPHPEQSMIPEGWVPKTKKPKPLETLLEEKKQKHATVAEWR